MRLWHKDLIPVLPRQQLLSQWRECCCIARNIAVNGTPNHLLVNKILTYPPEHFYTYARMVQRELFKRDYVCDFNKFLKWYKDIPNCWCHEIPEQGVFACWHGKRYFDQCYYNLQEKYDCGGISEEEWQLIELIK